ncbi:MAG: hypothetical protein ACO1TE_14530, partial [Prosthecobacter sp.]
QIRIPSKFGFKPAPDIQVLTPMHRGLAGAQNLNREMQNLLNPGGAGVERGGVMFRVGQQGGPAARRRGRGQEEGREHL